MAISAGLRTFNLSGAAIGYVAAEGLNLLARLYPHLAWIGAPGSTAAEFIDEPGTVGGANASRTVIDEKRLTQIFIKEIGHFFGRFTRCKYTLRGVANNAKTFSEKIVLEMGSMGS